MANVSEQQIEAILGACLANLAVVAEPLNLCFDSAWQLTAGDSLPWSPAAVPAAFDGPGLAVVFVCGTQSIVCLLPASLPLPEWHTHPDDSQESRLQTLGMEWSMCMLPSDFEVESYRTVLSSNLKEELVRGAPPEWGAILPLTVTSGEKTGQLLLVVPLEQPAFALPPSPAAPAKAEPAPTAAAVQSAAAPAAPATPLSPQELAARARARRLLKLPVRVSVRLAEKRIELGQLMAIAPGALLTFNKSCEASLDLYVNNFRYCRGEAVKIGENFGLKIDEVGVEEVRTTKIMF